MRNAGKAAWMLAACLLFAAVQASAQVPQDIAAKLKDIGRVVAPPPTAALYVPLQGTDPYSGMEVKRDLKYGTDPRQTLDVVTAPGAAGARPVLVFVHGGGFIGGNKTVPNSPFYGNVATWAVKNGFVGVNMTYRLAPQNPWPAGRDDVASAIRWVRENIAASGGDPQRIFLMGHSAGAIHVASYVADVAEKGESPIAAALMVSALYDFTPENISNAERAYFGEDRARLAEGSSLSHLAKAKFPLFVAHGELDPPNFVGQSELANKTLCAPQKCPRFVRLADHSHMSEIYAVGTADVSLTREILAFTRGVQ
ncbi:alpha/beta hydrolase [Methylocella sp. CPCC 101449]|uniref:alpha/beta hydrolase n=1 Tax=Methylocella sp. CPCC 101449 TaxID=2987531 RepID=UPI0028906738|nr:alpha/beta hydrolase [Methylocella sp. CPCC 101449]MDT2021115.1 alpha/beta hydrolase [Methylocella sp. CPCC 101449]